DRFRGTSMLDVIRAFSHSLRSRLFAAALMLPLVALATATSGVDLRCRITGEVLSACCCDGADGAAAKAEPPATVSQADCCDRLVRDVTAAPAELSARATTGVLSAPTAQVATLAFERPSTGLDPSAFAPRSEARASIG